MATSKYSIGAIVSTPKGDVRILSRKPGKRLSGGKRLHPRIVVEVLKTGTVLDIQQGNLTLGKFNDYRTRTVYGVGYIGSSIVIPDRGEPSLIRRIYDLWANMLKRSYGGYSSCGTYTDVTVDPRWHSFTNFLSTLHKVPGYAEWEKNLLPLSLDKDIRGRGKRLYSLDTCMFVSPSDNTREVLFRRWRGSSDAV